jgi:hypothetical protein
MDTQQENSQISLHWESGLAKSIYNLDEDGNIKQRLCADFTIYGPLNEPYLVIEVAYSQTSANVKEKVNVWLANPHVAGVILVEINENPSYKAPDYPVDEILPKMSRLEWSRAIAACPKFGPLEVRGLKWAGAHQVAVTVYCGGEIVTAEVEQITIFKTAADNL